MTFTWLARDLKALKEHGVLTPKRNPSGRLSTKSANIIFKGKVGGGEISIISGTDDIRQQGLPEAPTSISVADRTSWSTMPALHRTAGPDDDPNSGRFGGNSSVDGFTLHASFEAGKNRAFATVVLTIRSERPVPVGRYAFFVLHPTFSPSEIKVLFRGEVATLKFQAWKGFTVGAWLPNAGIDLEFSLRDMKGAPKIIRGG